jgi:hypothetical protein
MTPNPLGTTARTFAVLASATITNTGPTRIDGNIGASPGSSITGFPPGASDRGPVHAADAVALEAQKEAAAAFTLLSGLQATVNMTGRDLGGQTLVPGVYRFSSSAHLTGTLTLDAGGDPNAHFVFQIGSTLVTASDSRVVLVNGARGDEVYWQVGSSATLGTDTRLTGTVLALASVTLNTRASIVCGRAMALNGAVTLDDNHISVR